MKEKYLENMHRDTHMHNDLQMNLLRRLLMKQLKIMTISYSIFFFYYFLIFGMKTEIGS